MKFKKGDRVIVLDTNMLPAANGQILEVRTDSNYYLVKYRLANSEKDLEGEIPEDRLKAPGDIVNSLKR